MSCHIWIYTVYKSIRFGLQGSTLSMLGKKNYTEIFLFFPENRIQHFMQIVSLGDNLHEIAKPTF